MKQIQKSQRFHSFLIHLPVRRLASLERMVYLESCGLTEGWFFVGRPWVLTCFTLGSRQEQEMTRSQPKNDPLSWVMFEEMMF